MQSKEYIKVNFGISEAVQTLAQKAQTLAATQCAKIEEIKELNQYKVIQAMQEYRVSETMFSGTSGYGYDDRGRDTLDQVYAKVFGAEAALVRSQIISGTQAIAICLFGILRPGMHMISATGKPYDTLEEVIGLRGTGSGSLKEFGISYKQVDLNNQKIDLDQLERMIDQHTGLILLQRSRGYDWRNALSIDELKKACSRIKSIRKEIVILVDNCYGEFVDTLEPTAIGADLVAGSLIKNPGGGLALTGGYVAGKKEYVELAACRLTSPGLGSHVGPSLNQNRAFFQGLFMAPHIVGESLKGSVFCGQFMRLLGFPVSPDPEEPRGDMIQAIQLGKKELLIAFCQGIQKGSPVDSFVEPYPWDMPGYENQVIMAAGGFVQGASIELSADAPIKEPFIAYVQGGLVFEHVKLGLMIAVQNMLDEGLICL